MTIKNQNIYDEPEHGEEHIEDPNIIEKSINTKIYQLHKEYEYALNSKKSVIYVTGHITEDTLYEIMGGINLIREQRETTDMSPINIIIMSYGGDVYPMLGIIDFMRGLDIKVNIIVRGAAMSAAALIVSSATGKRCMTKNSILMLHEFSVELSNNTSFNFTRNAKHIEYLQSNVYNMLAEYTGKTKEFWIEKLQGDLYLNAEQAKEFGLIDEIL